MIWYAFGFLAIFSFSLLFLLFSLNRRVNELREVVQDLGHGRAELEKELLALARQSDARGAEVVELTHHQQEIKKKVGQTLRAFSESMLVMEKGLKTLADTQKVAAHKQTEERKENLLPAFDSPLVTEVLALLDEGTEPTEIARMKGMQVGEVDLIRGLRYFAGKDS